MACGQICRATRALSASSITQDNAHSTSKTRSTMRTAAPFPATSIVAPGRGQHNAPAFLLAAGQGAQLAVCGTRDHLLGDGQGELDGQSAVRGVIGDDMPGAAALASSWC